MEETKQQEPTVKEEKPVVEEKKPKAKGTAKKGILYEFLILGIKIAAIIGVFAVVFTLIFGLFRTSDLSMYPAIRDGDLVMYYRFDKNYVTSDTVAVQYNGETQVRRVIAIEGDKVDIKNGKLYINGAAQQERDIYEVTDRYESEVEFPLVVQEGEVFLLGDGREHATDSRIYGCVPVNKTLGKVTMVIRTRRS